MKALLISFISLYLLGNSFKIEDTIVNDSQKQIAQGNLKTQLKYNGKGFDANLLNVFTQAITDSGIFYRGKYDLQTEWIRDKLNTAKPGVWNVFIVINLNITKITQISTGFYYWNFNDTWAFWYNTSSYSKDMLHLAIYNGDNTTKGFDNNVTTLSEQSGKKLVNETKDVINSVVDNLNTVQEISKYISKFTNQSWSVMAFPNFAKPNHPDAYASLTADGIWMTITRSVYLDQSQYSLILYV